MAVSTSAPKVASPSLIHTVRGPFGMQRGIDKAKVHDKLCIHSRLVC